MAELLRGIKVMNNVKIYKLIVSLGNAETLIQHPASIIHSPYTLEEREDARISDNLVRVAVGFSFVEVIIWDFEQTLNLRL